MSVQLESIIDLLKRELTFHTLCRQLAYRKIVMSKSKALGLSVSDDEVQAEADRVRRELRLESAQRTMEWLQERMVTAEEWEASIRDRLLTQKLAEEMFAEAAIRQFNENRLDYEGISLYKILLLDGPLAQELAYRIEEKEVSFFEAAHRYDSELSRRRCCGYEGEISRWQLPPQVAAHVFAAPAQTIIGPISLEHSQFGLFWVDEFIEPQLTQEIYRTIYERLFYDWLDSELQCSET